MSKSQRNVPIVGILLACALAALVGCGSRPAVKAPSPADGESTGRNADGAVEEKSRSKSDLDRSVDEIFSNSTVCEHGIPQYTCAECRYQLGVVKLSLERVAEGNGRGFETAAVSQRPLSGGQVLSGEVKLDEGKSVFIGPRAPGVVRTIRVDVGQAVRQGQVLFEIESAGLSDALAEHLKAAAAVRLAEATERRESDLFERRICPEKDLLEARAALEAARATEQASHQRLLRLGLTPAEADAVSPRSNDARGGLMPIRAPFAGTVLDRALNLGALVEPGEKNLLLADTSRVWVMTNVYERELAAILDQQARGKVSAEVTVPAFANRVFRGSVDTVGGTIDEATRTAKARVVVDNTGGVLRPGMFAQVRLLLDSGQKAVAVPAEAILEDEGRSFVFVKHDADYFVRRPVTTGRSADDWVEITQGLRGGETIVTRGAFLLKSDILRSKMGAGCAD